MSSDNGVYVLKTPADSGNGFEYRVAYASTIENIHFENEDGNPEQVVSYFGKSAVFDNEHEALKAAFEINRKFGWTEYGICQLLLPYPFSYYVGKAKGEKER